ncbi:MAG: hypothetical protein M3R55_01705 [Acidobacteriota bacterium]|nr:hypothetical protein [Acidobacteriota bacterium]
MKTCVVIGGARWGRILAQKFRGLGFNARTATAFPAEPSDITRVDIARMDPRPDLIYVASRSADHERDYLEMAALGAPVWVEKNFSGTSVSLREQFLSGDNLLFTQQLFNTSIDRNIGMLPQLTKFDVAVEIDRPVMNRTQLFDWVGHDLGLLARVMWLRGFSGAEGVECTAGYEAGSYVLRYRAAGVRCGVTLTPADKTLRLLRLDGGDRLYARRDGVLHLAPGGVTAEPGQQDLLGDALAVALRAGADDRRRLTAITMDLHEATFPELADLPYQGGGI